MNTLVLMYGAPGSGKSTFIKKLELNQFTLSPDDIRSMYTCPQMNVDGTMGISQKNDKKVWELLFNLLEKRMASGEFVVVDATHFSPRSMPTYKKLVNKYRYRVFAVDFNVPMEIAIKQNFTRFPAYKRVPEGVIRYKYENRQDLPTWIKLVKPEEFWESIVYEPDLSEWKRIHHIGDIQGCATPLLEYMNKNWRDDELFIFTGDYLDRGIENGETLEYMLSIYNKPNVILIRGNHEIHLEKYANDESIGSHQFNEYTIPQISHIDKKDIRNFVRKMRQAIHYTYLEKNIVVTHGGIPRVPDQGLVTLPTERLVKGVGDYEDDIDAFWSKLNGDNSYQVHGHRNINNLPVVASPTSFNLEGNVEFGGHLRVLTLDKYGFNTFEVKNNIHQSKEFFNIDKLVRDMRHSPHVKESVVNERISAFNYTKEAFSERKWSYITRKARGLFIDHTRNVIVGRSYDKFFNVGENESTLENVLKTLEYPAVASIKENGFLGVLGYDDVEDRLLFFSKSGETEYAKMFEELASSMDLVEAKRFCKEENASLTFEVIHKNDPHIIKYNESKLVLLDAVRRTLDEEYLPLPNIGVEVRGEEIIHNQDEFLALFDRKDEIEGFVVTSNLKVKIKLPYYMFWKNMRSLVNSYNNGTSISSYALQLDGAKEFFKWFRGQENKELDIITLRELYLAK